MYPLSAPYRMLALWVACLGCLQSPLRAQNEKEAFHVATPLRGDWQVQPAEGPDSPPDPAQWGRVAVNYFQADLLNGNASPVQPDKWGAGTSWKNRNREEIHSLWYQASFDLPAEWSEQRIVLDFQRIEGDAIVFINDQKIGELLRPGGELDVTSAVKFGSGNVLRVFLTRDYTGISRKFEQDPLRYFSRAKSYVPIPMSKWGLGITAPVLVERRPASAITDVFCQPSWKQKKLTVRVETTAQTKLTGCILEAEVRDATGKRACLLQSEPLTVNAGVAAQQISQSWPNPTPWELDRPYLYHIQVSLKRDGKTLDVFPEVTFGFREIWTEGRELIMNGHPTHWRVSELYSPSVNALSVYRQLGYNVGQRQPHPSLWWRDWAETPWNDEAVIEAADRIGYGLLMPAPSVSVIRGAFLRNETLRTDYQRECEFYFRRYRNHPSILAWVPSMNSLIDRESISPQGLGRRYKTFVEQASVISSASAAIKASDPTRLVYGHAEGGVADIATTNEYLNFAPLQEREEWPSQWKADGDMPYGAVEFGSPFTANFWKGKQILLTEYTAIYFGEDAYRRETEEALKTTVRNSLNSPADPNNLNPWGLIDKKQYPAYWDFQRLFVKNTNRSWRTSGVPAGWMYWIIEQGYGDPDDGLGPRVKTFLTRYKFLKNPIEQKPNWANENWDIYKQANQDLLVYIAGSPVATDKTARYYSGEIIRKNIVVVWDGSEPRDLSLEWTLEGSTSPTRTGKSEVHIGPGEIKLVPIEIKGLNVTNREKFKLKLRALDKAKELAVDEFELDVFPLLKSVAPLKAAALYDPLNRSTEWLKQLGVEATPWKPGQSLNGTKVLIIGREALKAGDRLFKPEEIAAGLNVLILEQMPAIWEGLGFKTIEAMPRYVFMRDKKNPVLNTLRPEDMINWRGTPDLLPEGRWARDYDSLHAPKWTNRHAVASVVFKIPQLIGFTPVLQTEFDLDYSPLLQWRYGKGTIWFSTLDLTGRVGIDPAATILAANLLRRLSETSDATRTVAFDGSAQEKEWLRRLQLDMSGDANSTALVLSESSSANNTERASKIAELGGWVFHLPQSISNLQKCGLKVLEQTVLKLPSSDDAPVLAAIGPNLLRWRDPLKLVLIESRDLPTGTSVLAGGLALERKIGKGSEIFCQLNPSAWVNTRGEAGWKEAVQLSPIRIDQFYCQLLTNLGASPTSKLAERLSVVSKPQSYETLGHWRIAGPYLQRPSAGLMIDYKYSAEDDAIEGAINPNLTYRREDGAMLDWRKEVNADAKGFVDLGEALQCKRTPAVAYATRTITSREAKTVRVRIGVDYWMRAWLNGKEILVVNAGHGEPRSRQYLLDLPLNVGDNVLTFKIGAGQNGFGFWADMVDDSDMGKAVEVSADAAKIEFYTPLFKIFDPYQFTYW